jgi:hypothetical protein
MAILDGVFDTAAVGPIAGNFGVAVRLAEAGIHVFPCDWRPKPADPEKLSKKPMLDGWREKSTTDTIELVEWWTRWPNALVGIDCAKAGLAVVDLDRHGGPDGVAAFDEIAREHDILVGPVTRTQSGGFHVFFRQPESEPLGNREGALAGRGINIRGAGGYVVGPGSVLPDGRAWRLDDDSPDLADAFERGEIPPLPEPLARLIGGPKREVSYDHSAPSVSALQCPSLSRDDSGEEREFIEAAIARIPSDDRDTWLRVGAALHDSGHAWARAAWDDWSRASHKFDGHDQDKTWGSFDRQYSGSKVTLGSIIKMARDHGFDGKKHGNSADCRNWNSFTLGKLADPPFDPETGEIEMSANMRIATRDGVTVESSPLNPLQPGRQEAAYAARPIIRATPFTWPDCASIPPREWLYGHHYIRKFVSVTVAPGGVGKSSLVIADALAMASGRELLSDMKPHAPLNVWLWNGEDPIDELNRRIAATAKHYSIRQEDCRGLFVDSGRDSKIVIAEMIKGSFGIVRPMVDAVKATILENKIDVLIVDPFVKSHRVAENDNALIDAIASEWADIADQTGCSIELVHHSRKTGGGEVTLEDTRGASALISAARVARVLNGMTPEEAVDAGIENNRLFFRVDGGAKPNLSAPGRKARWYHMHSVDMGNSANGREGDSIGVVTDWRWPNAHAGVTTDHSHYLRDFLDSELRHQERSIRKGAYTASIRFSATRFFMNSPSANSPTLSRRCSPMAYFSPS